VGVRVPPLAPAVRPGRQGSKDRRSVPGTHLACAVVFLTGDAIEGAVCAEEREESHLKTEVTEGEGHEVTLKVEAGLEDITDILEQTYRDLGSKIKIPGFRKGKIPKKVIDSHLGAEYVQAEAIKNGLPTLYVLGVVDAGIVPVSDPKIELLETGEEGRIVFEAKVDVKPVIEVKDYKGLELVAPDTEVSDEDVAEALDEARDRFATLEVIEGRPAEKGDFVMFDYKVFTDGVPLEGKAGTDRMTEIGSGDFLPGFDEQLEGARKGDIMDVVITFPADYGEAALAGKPATFRTIVKEIKRKVLPPLDDDLAKEVSHFETLEEFKEDLRTRIARVKEMMGERTLKEQAVQALVDKTYVDMPDSMVEHQVSQEIEAMSEELAERNITLDDYLAALKGTRYELEKAISGRVADSLKAELILDAVATAENVEVSDDEVEDYIRENALAAGGDPEKVIEEARKHNRIMNVRANLRLSKAVDVLVENAELTGKAPLPTVEVGTAGELAAKGAEPAEAEAGEPAVEASGEETRDEAAEADGPAEKEEAPPTAEDKDTGAQGAGEEQE
jgi:trigger factor